MQSTANYILELGGFIIYATLIIIAATAPLWAYKLVEEKFLCKHKALRVDKKQNTPISSSQIIASIGTTSAGVFMIQILPLVFSIINDLGGEFAVPVVYGEHISGALPSEYIESFYAITAQLGDVLQTAAPMAAVGLGGYNLLNNISRGLPAIIQKENESKILQKSK